MSGSRQAPAKNGLKKRSMMRSEKLYDLKNSMVLRSGDSNMPLDPLIRFSAKSRNIRKRSAMVPMGEVIVSHKSCGLRTGSEM